MDNYIDRHPLEVEAMETILGIKDEFVNKIPEDIFVKRYLPILANKEGNTNLSEWLSIAGHVYAEVDVVDSSGNVVFRVPSIFKRMKTKEHKLAHQSVHEIIETSKLHSNNSPIQGEAMLEQGLRTALPEQVIELDDDARWNGILKRYGYPIIGDKISEAVPEPTATEDKSIDGYDVA